MKDTHVAAIIKGLVEQQDPFAHFGSLLGYGHHRETAVSLGLITGETHHEQLTNAGRAYYETRNLKDLPPGRANNWCLVRGDDDNVTKGPKS